MCEKLCQLFCRGSVRLYADFYQSDILVASPIGVTCYPSVFCTLRIPRVRYDFKLSILV